MKRTFLLVCAYVSSNVEDRFFVKLASKDDGQNTVRPPFLSSFVFFFLFFLFEEQKQLLHLAKRCAELGPGEKIINTTTRDEMQARRFCQRSSTLDTVVL